MSFYIGISLQQNLMIVAKLHCRGFSYSYDFIKASVQPHFFEILGILRSKFTGKLLYSRETVLNRGEFFFELLASVFAAR